MKYRLADGISCLKPFIINDIQGYRYTGLHLSANLALRMIDK
jgi:hypothetical protein